MRHHDDEDAKDGEMRRCEAIEGDQTPGNASLLCEQIVVAELEAS
jgi:hypothetical protein